MHVMCTAFVTKTSHSRLNKEKYKWHQLFIISVSRGKCRGLFSNEFETTKVRSSRCPADVSLSFSLVVQQRYNIIYKLKFLYCSYERSINYVVSETDK